MINDQSFIKDQSIISIWFKIFKTNQSVLKIFNPIIQSKSIYKIPSRPRFGQMAKNGKMKTMNSRRD